MARAPLTLFLIRIDDRHYGFTVLAVIAKSEDDAKALATKIRGANWDGPVWRSCRAEIVGTAAVAAGAHTFMEFEE